MLLNFEEVIAEEILKNATLNNYENASYNLTIGSIIDSHGKSLPSYSIPPQGMVMVISKEVFSLKENIVGYTTVKNGLSINGILAINIGIVDSGYNGPISSVLINFGQDSFEIDIDQTFMRMTFHKFAIPDSPKPLSARNQYNDGAHYIDERKKDAKILGDKFLYLDNEIKKYKDQTVKGVKDYFFKIGAYLTFFMTAVGILLTGASYVYSVYSDNNAVKKYESIKVFDNMLRKQDSVIKKNIILYKELDSITMQNKNDLSAMKKLLPLKKSIPKTL